MKGIGEEVITDYFKVLFWYLPGRTEERTKKKLG
jgi:hypothetical protein